MLHNITNKYLTRYRTLIAGTILVAGSTSPAWGQLDWTPAQEGFPLTPAEISGFES